ncbi:hypothetical protein NYY81_19105, partial [Acinetobacter baumannii]|nr:hypothetical protein [Acinetobacter baumannii]
MSLLISNVRLYTAPKERVDVLIEDGVIRQIGPNLAAPAAQRLDGKNQLLLPGFIDGHAHIDKSL